MAVFNPGPLLGFKFSRIVFWKICQQICNSWVHSGHWYKCSNVINSERYASIRQALIRQGFLISQVSNYFLSSYGTFCKGPDVRVSIKGWAYFFPLGTCILTERTELSIEYNHWKCVQANTIIPVFGNGK